MAACGRKQSLTLLPVNGWYREKQTLESADSENAPVNGWYAPESSLSPKCILSGWY